MGPARLVTRSTTVVIGVLTVVMITAAAVAVAGISAGRDQRAQRAAAVAAGGIGDGPGEAGSTTTTPPPQPAASAPFPDITRPAVPGNPQVRTPAAPDSSTPGPTNGPPAAGGTAAAGPSIEAGVSYHVHVFDWSYPSVWAEAGDDDAHITRLVVDWGDGTQVTVGGDPEPCQEGPDGKPTPSSARIPLDPPLSHQYGSPADYRVTVTAYSSRCDGSDVRATMVAPSMAPYPWPPMPPPPVPPAGGPPSVS